MPYFLSGENLVQGQTTNVAGQEARHILLAHRAKKGERVKLQGPDGKRFLSEIISIAKTSLVVKPLENLAVPAEPQTKITLFQSLVSEKALDFIFQKGTELGLQKIVLFNSANTATKLSADNFEKKQGRWQKILIEAAKQCERGQWPTLEFAPDVNEAIEKMKSSAKIFLADISGEKLKALHDNPQDIGLVIGPEGGFIPGEIKFFKTLPNLQTISLGSILLRAETAALATIAILNH